MEIKLCTIKLDTPPWLRRAVVYVAIPAAAILGVSAVVYADVVVPNTFATGDTLDPDKMNENFGKLASEIDVLRATVDAQAGTITSQQASIAGLTSQLAGLQNADCPAGYARDGSAASITLCIKGPDEVVKVGTGGSAFWVDRYEASVWAAPDGTGAQYGLAQDYPATFPNNGEFAAPLYALSVSNKKPSAFISWFQADAACEASGKRLAMGLEWVKAARGTADPGDSSGTGGACVTNALAFRHTGLGTACRSAWGAEDMIGNAQEWTADWYAAPGAADTTYVWPAGSFQDDGLINIAGGAYDGSEWRNGLPVAAVRGGGRGNLAYAGRFALNVSTGLWVSRADIGFRCVIPR